MGDGAAAVSDSPAAAFCGALRAERWFAGLSPDVQEAILRGGIKKRLKRGQLLFRQGDAPTGLYAVTNGQMHCQAENYDGKTVVVSVLHAPDWVGFLACADGKPYTFDVVAAVDSELLFVPIGLVRTLFHSSPAGYQYLISPQLNSMRRIYRYLMNALHFKPIERLAFLLIALSRSPWYDDGAINPLLGMSQETLAASLYACRQDTNKLLGELERRGAIRKSYGKIEVIDEHMLMQIAKLMT